MKFWIPIEVELPELRTQPKLVRKRDSWSMKALNFLLRPITSDFMTRFWTTTGHTIYAPEGPASEADFGQPAWITRHRRTLAHEWVHIAQVERWGHFAQAQQVIGPAPSAAVAAIPLLIWTSLPWWLLVPIPILLLPFSFGLAWGRWRIEREAYLVSLKLTPEVQRPAALTRIVATLWNDYGWVWPRKWMRAWFSEAMK